jgi:alkyl hydroperoxide reductase subunit AhpC
MAIKLNQEVSFKKMQTNFGYINLSELSGYYKFRVGFSYLSNFTKVDVSEILIYDKLYKYCKQINLPFYFFGFNIDQTNAIMQFYYQINKEINTKIETPMLYDNQNELSNLFDMNEDNVGVAENRIVFILDENNKLKYFSQHDINTGSNIEEVFRVLLNLYDRYKSKVKKFYACNAYPSLQYCRYNQTFNNQITYNKIYNDNLYKIKKYMDEIWISIENKDFTTKSNEDNLSAIFKSFEDDKNDLVEDNSIEPPNPIIDYDLNIKYINKKDV